MGKSYEDYEKLGKEEVSRQKGHIFMLMVLILSFLVGFASPYVYYYVNPPTYYDHGWWTEELKIISVTFPSSSSAQISVTNTGVNTLTISTVTIDDYPQTAAYGGSIGTDGSLQKGLSGTITISGWTWHSGTRYTFAVITTRGDKYTYTTTAAP
jgi:hypothetical protein